MGARLLWRPALERVDIEQAVNKVNEGFAVSHFSLDLVLLHALPGHRVVADNIRQTGRVEVLLARLFLGTMFPGVLLHGLEAIGPPPKFIMHLFVEFAGLLANLQHPIWRQTKHLGNARDLIVFRATREQRQAEEQFNDNATK